MSDQLKEVNLERGVSTKKLKEQNAEKKKPTMKQKSVEYTEAQHEDPEILRRMRTR